MQLQYTQYDLRKSLAVIGLIIASFLLVILPLNLLLLGIGVIVASFILWSSPLLTLNAMLILSPLRTLIATESNWNLPLDIGQLGFFAFVASIFIHRLRNNEPFKLTWDVVQIPILGFVLITTVNVFVAPVLGVWLTEWLKWVIVLILVSLMCDFDGRDSWKWVIFGLCVGATANALVGVYIFFGGSGADHLLINGRFFRAFGTLGQPNPFGGYMGLIAPVALSVTGWYLWRILTQIRTGKLTTQTLFHFIVYGAMSGLIVLAIIFSWSRGAWLGFGIACLVMGFALPRRLWQSVALTLTIIVFVFIGVVGGIIPESIVNRLTDSAEEYVTFRDMRGVDINDANYAVVERLAHWQVAINMFDDKPIWGVGFGHYEVVYDDYRLINWEEALGHAHNYYLNILAETGIMGGLFYGVMWLMLFLYTWRLTRQTHGMMRFVAIGLLGSWSYLSVHSLTDNLYVNNLFLHIGVLVGVLVLLRRQSNRIIRWM